MMNRQQFVAELSQYLTFVSPEQRNEIIAYYSDRLDQAGPQGEADALAEIGTPMSVAITLKRRLEANELLIPKGESVESPNLVRFEQKPEEAVPEAPVFVPEAVPQPAPAQEEPAAPPETEAEPEAPEAEPSENVETEAEASSEAEENASEATEEISEEAPHNEEDAAEEPAEEPAAEESVSEEPEPVIEQKAPASAKIPAPSAKKPVTFGRVLGAIGIAIVSIVIVAFFTCIAAAGGVVGESGVEIIISGVTTDGYLTDALMVLAAGAVVFAAGLLITWFAVWAAIALIASMIRHFNGTPAPEKSKLKTVWNVVLIILAVCVCVGIICGVVSTVMGGSFSVLSDDPAYNKLMSRLDPSNIIGFIESIGIIG